MHRLNLPHKLSSFKNIIIEFVKRSYRREFWTRKFGQGMEIQAINDKRNKIEGQRSGRNVESCTDHFKTSNG